MTTPRRGRARSASRRRPIARSSTGRRRCGRSPGADPGRNEEAGEEEEEEDGQQEGRLMGAGAPGGGGQASRGRAGRTVVGRPPTRDPGEVGRVRVRRPSRLILADGAGDLFGDERRSGGRQCVAVRRRAAKRRRPGASASSGGRRRDPRPGRLVQRVGGDSGARSKLRTTTSGRRGPVAVRLLDAAGSRRSAPRAGEAREGAACRPSGTPQSRAVEQRQQPRCLHAGPGWVAATQHDRPSSRAGWATRETAARRAQCCG